MDRFSANAAHETWNNLKYLQDVAGNPLITRLSCLFSGFVIAGNVMEKRANGFS